MASNAAAATTDGQIHQQLAKYKVPWDKLGMQQGKVDNLKLLEIGANAAKSKAILHGNLTIIEACFEAMTLKAADEQTCQNVCKWMLTVFVDMLREDASCYSIFEEALKGKLDVYRVFTAVMKDPKSDVYTKKTAAWILTSVIGFLSRFFTEAQVIQLAKDITGETQSYTQLGVVESMTNLFKSDTFRNALWKQADVKRVFTDSLEGSSFKNLESEMLYKIIFAIWLLSLDREILEDLKRYAVPKKIKDILSTRRVEKVVRISLIALKSLLKDRGVCEDIVEAGAYDAVTNLEFEKWRDAELYDEIRDMGQQISLCQHEMSNFNRYEKELSTGQLRWGFIHTSKFWGENVMKFEQDDFKAVRTLCGLLNAEDPETQAVACHDLGEFVTLHPFGKKQVHKLNVKPRVMELMQLSGDSDKHREVRREALLCCQKIMLNKWQDIDKKAAN